MMLREGSRVGSRCTSFRVSLCTIFWHWASPRGSTAIVAKASGIRALLCHGGRIHGVVVLELLSSLGASAEIKDGDYGDDDDDNCGEYSCDETLVLAHTMERLAGGV